jgi:hypothetical protein
LARGAVPFSDTTAVSDRSRTITAVKGEQDDDREKEHEEDDEAAENDVLEELTTAFAKPELREELVPLLDEGPQSFAPNLQAGIRRWLLLQRHEFIRWFRSRGLLERVLFCARSGEKWCARSRSRLSRSPSGLCSATIRLRKRHDVKKPRSGRSRLWGEAGRTGLEPAASGVTGRRYNRLNYRPRI